MFSLLKYHLHHPLKYLKYKIARPNSAVSIMYRGFNLKVRKATVDFKVFRCILDEGELNVVTEILSST